MLSRHWLFILGGAIVLITLPWLLKSEQDRVLERLEELRGLAEISTTESGIQLLTRTREIARRFTDRTRFDLSNAGYGITEIPNRQELEQKILSASNRISTLELTMEEPVVDIEGDTASVRLRGTALGTLRGEREPFLDIHSVEVLLSKEDGTWLVSGARHLRDERQP